MSVKRQRYKHPRRTANWFFFSLYSNLMSIKQYHHKVNRWLGPLSTHGTGNTPGYTCWLNKAAEYHLNCIFLGWWHLPSGIRDWVYSEKNSKLICKLRKWYADKEPFQTPKFCCSITTFKKHSQPKLHIFMLHLFCLKAILWLP